MSTFNRTGLEALKEYLNGKISAFAGPSGVGKSSMLNVLQPGIALQTGKVSEKIGRGRHTTRYAQLLPFNGGYLADTPGFGNLLAENIDAREFISISVNLSILNTAANLFRARIRMNRSAA